MTNTQSSLALVCSLAGTALVLSLACSGEPGGSGNTAAGAGPAGMGMGGAVGAAQGGAVGVGGVGAAVGGASASAGVAGGGGDPMGAGGMVTGAGGVGVAGAGGAGMAGASVGGAAGSAGAGMAGMSGSAVTTVDSGELVGWATQAGGTDGGGNATPEDVSSSGAFDSAIGSDSDRVVRLTGNVSGVFDVGSNTTIIGVGPNVTLSGGLHIDGKSNIIIKNININASSSDGDADGDGIRITQSDHIWLDHLAVYDAPDGNVDITDQSDYISVSWSKFYYTSNAPAPDHKFSNLVGASDNQTDDRGHLRVTFYRNWWAEGIIGRMPRTRFGQVHVFNNLYTSVGNDFCVGAGIESLVRLEGNFFAGVEDPHQFQDDSTGAQLFVPLSGANANFYGGATGVNAPYDAGGDSFTPPYSAPLDPGTSVPAIIEAGAGPQ